MAEPVLGSESAAATSQALVRQSKMGSPRSDGRGSAPLLASMTASAVARLAAAMGFVEGEVLASVSEEREVTSGHKYIDRPSP